jgi:hypothetical protein
MQLVACSRCNRHIRVTADRCPFCGAAAEARLVARLVAHGGRLSRAAIFAGTAACYTSSPQPVQGPPPPPPPNDADVQPPPPPPPPDAQSTGFAQPPPDGSMAGTSQVGRIEGRVNSGVYNMQVYLNGQQTRRQTQTDPGGGFKFENLPPGRYTVELPGNGNPRRPPPRQTVEVTANGVAHVLLEYEPYVPDNGPCCKPYGAPPARRRVV